MQTFEFPCPNVIRGGWSVVKPGKVPDGSDGALVSSRVDSIPNGKPRYAHNEHPGPLDGQLPCDYTAVFVYERATWRMVQEGQRNLRWERTQH